ncbi:HNH endonuclease signature motif containing protein [Pseudonocardia eucalypti]|uniref:HNH endonuclease signature motif containing protein n=1 Tax=Pseudonocardia eucalypti TaxID=648755 RepID=UPI0031EE2E53
MPGRPGTGERTARAWSGLLRWFGRIAVVVGTVLVGMLAMAGPAWAGPALAEGFMSSGHLDWARLIVTVTASALALTWGISYRLRGRSPPDTTEAESARRPGWLRRAWAAVRGLLRLDKRVVVGLALFGGLFVVGTLGVPAATYLSAPSPLAMTAAILGGTLTVLEALTAHTIRVAEAADPVRQPRVPVRVVLAAIGTAAVAGAAVFAVFGSLFVPISAVLVAAAVTEGALIWAGRAALAGPAAPPATPSPETTNTTHVPATVAGTPLAAQWPRIRAARTARHALAVLFTATAIAFGLTLNQLVAQVETGLPAHAFETWDPETFTYQIDYLKLVMVLAGSSLLPGVFNYVRTVMATIGPSFLALGAERVSTPRLLSRLGAGIGLATVGLGTTFVAMTVGFGKVFLGAPLMTVAIGATGMLANAIATRLYQTHRNPTGRALSRHAIGGTLIGAGTVAVGLGSLAGLPALGQAAGVVIGGLVIVVGLTTIADMPLTLRHPLRAMAQLARALPGMPLLLARRLLDIPEVVRDVVTLVKVYARFARTEDASFSLTEEELADRAFLAVIESSPRYAVRGDRLVDTYRIWRDWSSLTELPDDLTDLQRRSARAAIAAGLSRGETARLLGVKRRTLRRWLRTNENEHGDGGPLVADMPNRLARLLMLPIIRRLLAGAQKLSADVFPNLARGPPELVRLVRITDQAPLGGRLVGFGWRARGAAPEDGRILVPRHIAELVEWLISVDPGFAQWWEDFLRHEWDHINGAKHTGHEHDAQAAELLRRLHEAIARAVANATRADLAETPDRPNSRSPPSRSWWRALWSWLGTVVLAVLGWNLAALGGAPAAHAAEQTATKVVPTQAGVALASAGAAADGATLLVAAVAAVVITAIAEKVWKALVQASERATAAIQARLAWLQARAGRMVAGVFTGFGLAALADHWLAAEPLVWAGVVLAIGDLILRVMPNAILRDLGKDWTKANPPVRLFGAGLAFGAFWWLHAMVPTTTLVWALTLPVAAVATLAGGITALVHWRHDIGTALHKVLTTLVRNLNVAYFHAEPKLREAIRTALSSPTARTVRRWFPADRVALLAGGFVGVGLVMAIGHAFVVLAIGALLVAVAALINAVGQNAGWQGGWSQRGPPLITRLGVGVLLGAAVAALLLGGPAYAATRDAPHGPVDPTGGLIALFAMVGLVVAARAGHWIYGRIWRRAEVARLIKLNERGWVHAVRRARWYYNLEPEDYEDELADAEWTGVRAHPMGTPEAAKILAEHKIVLWVLRLDGTLWVVPAFGERRGTDLRIKHTIVSEGGAVVAAGMVRVRNGRGIRINNWSGHYHRDLRNRPDPTSRALGRAAFARHGITFRSPLHRLVHRGHDGALAWFLAKGWEDAIRTALRAVPVVLLVDPVEYSWSRRGPPPNVALVSAVDLARLLDTELGEGLGAQVTAHLIAYTIGNRIYVVDAWWSRLSAEQRALVIAHEYDAHVAGAITDHERHARETLRDAELNPADIQTVFEAVTEAVRESALWVNEPTADFDWRADPLRVDLNGPLEISLSAPTDHGYDRLYPSPHTIDGEAQELLGSSQCFALAAALHELTGWRIVVFDIFVDGAWWPAHGAVLTPDGHVLDIFGRATLAATEQKYREINDAEVRHRIVAVHDMPGDVWEEIAHLHGDPLWWAAENTIEMVALYSHFARLLVQENGHAEAVEFGAGRPTAFDESTPTRGPPLWQRFGGFFQRLITATTTAVLGMVALATPAMADTGTQPPAGTSTGPVLLGVGAAIGLAALAHRIWRHAPTAVTLLGVAVAAITGVHIAGIGQLTPVSNTVSGYVAAPGGFTFLAVGMVAMAAAVEFIRLVVRADTFTRVLLRLSSIALVLVAVFPTVPDDLAAFSSRMHQVAAGVLFIVLPWAAVRLARAVPGTRAMRVLAWAFAGTAAATIVRSLLTTIEAVDLPEALSLGVVERVALAIGVVTVGLIARPLPRGSPVRQVPFGGRKPHGSSLTARQIAAELRGERLPLGLRQIVASQARQVAELPSGFRHQAWYLRRWPLALAELLEGRRDGPVLTELADRAERVLGYRPELPDVRFHMLEAPIPDPSIGLAADAGYRRSRDVLRIYASWPDSAAGVAGAPGRAASLAPDGYAAGALHELVEAELARWAGLGRHQAHTVAVLAERALVTQRHRPRSWLTRRAIAELNHLAAHHRDVLLAQTAAYPGQLVHLEQLFADQPGWGALAARYAERYHHAATVRARQLPRRWAAPRGPPPTRRLSRPVIKLGSAGGLTAGEPFPAQIVHAAKADDPTATCVFCGRPGTGTQVDHVIPRARGGNATLPNAQLACPHCNQSKGDQDYPLHAPPGHLGAWPPAHWPARAIGGHHVTEPTEPDKPP